MERREADGLRAHLRNDLPASLVVFLVAVPLCLGIAVASGAPPLAGLITGMVGGLLVAWLSGSALAVSGPAAGLTTIVLAAIGDLGYAAFLLAVVLAGVLQFVLGAFRAGILAHYVPSTVIKGMLASIGLVLIFKQLPHAVGVDVDYEGDLAFHQLHDGDTFHTLLRAFRELEWVALVVSGAGLAILVGLETLKKKTDGLRWLPPPLVAVACGVAINQAFVALAPEIALRGDELVSIPTGGIEDLFGSLVFPDWSRITDGAVWNTAFVLAAVASIETLLCIEAIDEIDPLKRSTPTNRELMAQGTGNLVAGLLGALPMTAVIVRGTVNVQSGGRTRISSFLHGVWLLVAVVLAPEVMNLVPMAALAAVLLHVGYKLVSPTSVRAIFRQSRAQWLPYVVTVGGVMVTDLLTGVLVGLGVAIFLILRAHADTPFFVESMEQSSVDGRVKIRLELAPVVSFMHRASVDRMLHELPSGAIVEIHAQRTRHVHPDILELVRDLEATAAARGIEVIIYGELREERPSPGHTISTWLSRPSRAPRPPSPRDRA